MTARWHMAEDVVKSYKAMIVEAIDTLPGPTFTPAQVTAALPKDHLIITKRVYGCLVRLMKQGLIRRTVTDGVYSKTSRFDNLKQYHVKEFNEVTPEKRPKPHYTSHFALLSKILMRHLSVNEDATVAPYEKLSTHFEDSGFACPTEKTLRNQLKEAKTKLTKMGILD